MAQSFYVRLLTLVDDFGRCDGRPSVLHGSCFSVWNELHPDDEVTQAQVGNMLRSLVEAHLVEWYGRDGKNVLQFIQWTERLREGVKEHWPAFLPGVPASCSNPQQVAATRSETQRSAAKRSGSKVAATCSNLLPSSSPSPSSPLTIDRVPRKRGPSFEKPTLEAVKLQAAKIGLPEAEAEKFWNHYESNGWKVGRNPMRSWLAALTNWHTNFKNGTYAANNRTHGKPNPRNAGLLTDPTEQGRKIKEHLARQNSKPLP